MATTASAWNQAPSASLMATQPKANVSGTTGSGSSSSTTSASNSATISANDFLTLLVTEMQNQDPTSNADPNQYIDQLVQVNSLEQLVQMNQNLSTALGLPAPSSTSGTPEATAAAAPNASAASVVSATGAKAATHGAAGGSNLLSGLSAFSSGASSSSSQLAGIVNRATAATQGNIGIPTTSPAAVRVALSLSGQKNSP